MRAKKIGSLFNVRPVEEEVGIEIEMEGTGLADTEAKGQNMNPGTWPWLQKMDGSLRGESCEWVTKGALMRTKVVPALGLLWAAREKAKAKFTPSRRCGVHIHMNVQNLTEKQVFNLIGTYIALENVLIRWAGVDREGNLFCLRSSDARELLETLAAARCQGSLARAFSDHIRYASVNINAIQRYGSLEFRALGTPDQPVRIGQWVRMLYCVRELSLKTPVHDLITRVSRLGAKEFISEIFGPRSVLRHIPELEDMLREGARNVQDILLTYPSSVKGNNPAIPQEGWHVIDPEDQEGEILWQHRNRPGAPVQPVRARDQPFPLDAVLWNDVEEPPEEPDWDAMDRRELEEDDDAP